VTAAALDVRTTLLAIADKGVSLHRISPNLTHLGRRLCTAVAETSLVCLGGRGAIVVPISKPLGLEVAQIT
jgi:hypothetical protein